MITRRRFMSICGGLIASALVAACINESSEPEVDSVTVPAGDIPPAGEEPLHSDEGRFFLIHNEDGLLALYSKCTHQGCAVEWKGSDVMFNCPCHGSRFDRHGVDIQGPTERPLDLMAISVQSDGSLQVDTTAISEREEWSPDQSVQTS